MKQFKKIFNSNALPIAIALAATGLLCGLLWFRLGSLTFGNAAEIEAVTKASSGTLRSILDNPINAPYSVVHWLVGLTGHHGITSLRLISTMFAALAAVLFYIVARQWHSTRVALLASWLFVSSSWFLHIGRLGSPDILWLVSVLAIVVILTPNRYGRQNRLALPSTLIGLISVLYVPGMVWLVALGLVLRRKNIREAWTASRARVLRIASILASVVAIMPLVYALARSPSLVWHWLGLGPAGSTSLPPLATIADNLLSVPRNLLLSSSFDPVHWLANLPILSVFEIVMFLLGLFFYVTHLRAARSRLIVVLALVGCLLVGLMGQYAISLVVPVVYLLIAAGIAYILHQWFKVFPNNPIARTVGIAVIMIAVLLTSVYQTRSYFVAWRYNPETRQVFNIKL